MNANLVSSNLENEERSAQEPWLDSRAAAAYLGGLHYKTLERYARRNRVPAYFRFNRWYFRASELDAWLKNGISSNSQFVRKN